MSVYTGKSVYALYSMAGQISSLPLSVWGGEGETVPFVQENLVCVGGCSLSKIKKQGKFDVNGTLSPLH